MKWHYKKVMQFYYVKPYNSQDQLTSWVSAVKSKGIPCSDEVSLMSTLDDCGKLQSWQLAGLPADNFSRDNCIIMRWVFKAFKEF